MRTRILCSALGFSVAGMYVLTGCPVSAPDLCSLPSDKCSEEAGADASADATSDAHGDAMSSHDSDAASPDGAPSDGALGDGSTDTSVPCDSSTVLVCSGQCVDPTDPANCGSCTNACPTPSTGNGHATCTAPSTCGITCDSGYHLCNGACMADSDDPMSNPCVLTDGQGVFVAPSPQGNDSTGTGTAAAPYASITKALNALGSMSRIYVCNGGTYSEQVTVTTPVSIFGGLSCTGGAWTYATGTTSNVTSPSAAFALQVNGVSGAVLIEDMNFVAPDAVGSGASSYAVIVNESSNVAFHRTRMTSGNGQSGSPGSTLTNYPVGVAANPGQAPAVQAMSTGASPPICSCSSSSQVSGGGGGGNGETGNGTPGGSGSPNLPPDGSGNDGAGGAGQMGATACKPGGVGAMPSAIGVGGASGTGPGSLGASGWTAALTSTGAPGTLGAVAQGGGGGGGATYVGFASGGGGSGGCGGCGGGNGTGGSPGGSSFALVSVASTVALDSGCVLAAGTGGTGGGGGDGQVGQTGGTRGQGNGNGCQGGAGGTGTEGGGGGGGGGGHSIAIGYTVTMPSVNGAALSVKTAASGGTAGQYGSPAAGVGASGLSAQIQSF